MKKNGNKPCPKCHKPAQRWGIDKRTGKQRWRCIHCGETFFFKRLDVKERHLLKTFTNWITNSASKQQLKIRNRNSRRLFTKLWSKNTTIETYPWHTHAVVVIDAINLKTGKKEDDRTCLIACENGEVIAYVWVKYESSENWMKLFIMIDIYYAVVCDGQKGMLLAIRRRWPHIWIQRCLVHIHRKIISKISKHPETEVGEYLLSLAEWMLDIRTESEANMWVHAFQTIYSKYRDFIDEWHIDRDENGKVIKRWRKRKKLRSAYRELDNEIHNQTLFVYLINPNVPKATNDVEGGVNKQLRKLLGDHCGLTFEKQKKLVETYLYKRRKKDV